MVLIRQQEHGPAVYQLLLVTGRHRPQTQAPLLGSYQEMHHTSHLGEQVSPAPGREEGSAESSGAGWEGVLTLDI